jgi:hypothetical protein
VEREGIEPASATPGLLRFVTLSFVPLRFFAALASTLAGAWIMWPLWERLVG